MINARFLSQDAERLLFNIKEHYGIKVINLKLTSRQYRCAIELREGCLVDIAETPLRPRSMKAILNGAGRVYAEALQS